MPELTPKEVRQLWVKALRSGEYQQGTGCLKTDDGKYCCLGVLTDLAVKNGIVPFFVGGYGENNVLADEVQAWARCENKNGWFGSNSSGTCLGRMNDSGSVFEEIADTIEAEPEGLFSV